MTGVPPDHPSTPHRHLRGPRGRLRLWTWAIASVALVVALIAPAPTACAATLQPATLQPASTVQPASSVRTVPSSPCQAEIQAFFAARQAVIDHNAQPHVFPTQGQVNAYNEQSRYLVAVQTAAKQTAVDCLAAAAPRRTPPAPSTSTRVTQRSPAPSSSPSPGPTRVGADPTRRPAGVPEGWASQPTRTGNGRFWSTPGQSLDDNRNSVRVMPPGYDSRYPHGYARYYNGEGAGQALNAAGKPGTLPETHLSPNPDGSFTPPLGWNPTP